MTLTARLGQSSAARRSIMMLLSIPMETICGRIALESLATIGHSMELLLLIRGIECSSGYHSCLYV